MSPDALTGIIANGLELKWPVEEKEQIFKRLVSMGLITLTERKYVLCINPLDSDQPSDRALWCTGQIDLSPELIEEESDYRCPSCGRVVFPSRKTTYRSLLVLVNEAGIRQYVQRLLGALGLPVKEDPIGLFHISGRAGEVHVCLVDFCQEGAVFHQDYAYRQSIVYLVANDGEILLRMIPRGSKLYRIVDLALRGAGATLTRELKALARLEPASLPRLPAVWGMHPHPGSAKSSTATERFIVTPARIHVPPGLDWEVIEFFYLTGDSVAARMRGAPLRRYTASELGFSSKNGGKLTKKWALLMQLCLNNGQCEFQTISTKFSAFKQHVKALRAHLQELFGIKTDPFSVCSKTLGLRSAFKAYPDLPYNRKQTDQDEEIAQAKQEYREQKAALGSITLL